MHTTYDVAVWLSWYTLWPEVVEDVQAETPLLAMRDVIRRHGWQRAVKAAAHTSDGRISRWWYPICPPSDAESEEMA